MFKKLVVAAGLLLAANLSCGTSASAAPRHMLHNHRGNVALMSHRGRLALPRTAMERGRRIARRGLAPRTRIARVRATRHELSIAYRGHRHRGYRVARRLERPARQVAAVSRDTAIRSYVGPSSAYVPVSTPAATGSMVGGASFYSGGRTASGGLVGAATCAHRSLPFGTRVLVTNLANGAKTVLTVNDRGPFVRGRILDVSRSAAGVLGMLRSGTARIAMQVVGRPGSLLN